MKLAKMFFNILQAYRGELLIDLASLQEGLNFCVHSASLLGEK